MNEKEQFWVHWFLGVFGCAALFIALALMGFSMQGTWMGWLGFLLGTLAFLIVPYLMVGSRPGFLSGGIVGVAMAIGAMALILIFASMYSFGIPPLVVLGGLLLAFLGGSLGEPWLGTV